MEHDASRPAHRPTLLAEVKGLLAVLALVFGFQSLVAKPFYIPSESMMPTLLVGDRLVVSKYPYGWSFASVGFHLLPTMKGRLLARLPERGDVVVFTPPGAARRNQDWIKRVIGLPGDTVRVVAGRVWLNGHPLATRDLGLRLLPVDGNLRCDAHDPDPERAFPGYADAKVVGNDGRIRCRVHVMRETLPGGRSYETLDFGRTAADDFGPYVVPAGSVFLMGDNRDDSADSRVLLAQNGLAGAVPLENVQGRAEFVTFSLTGEANWNPLTWFGALRDRGWSSLRAAS